MICGVSAETSLFSTCPFIDLFTGSSPSYYLKSISATLPQPIFHSIFPCCAIILKEKSMKFSGYIKIEYIHNVKLYFKLLSDDCV